MNKNIKNGNGIIITLCIVLLLLIGASVVYGVKKIERNNEQANMLLYTNAANNTTNEGKNNINNAIIEGNETENNTNATQDNTTKTNTSSNNTEDE